MSKLHGLDRSPSIRSTEPAIYTDSACINRGSVEVLQHYYYRIFWLDAARVQLGRTPSGIGRFLIVRDLRRIEA